MLNNTIFGSLFEVDILDVVFELSNPCSVRSLPVIWNAKPDKQVTQFQYQFQ